MNFFFVFLKNSKQKNMSCIQTFFNTFNFNLFILVNNEGKL